MSSFLHVDEAVVVTSLEDDQDGHPPRQCVVEVDLDGDLELERGRGGGGRVGLVREVDVDLLEGFLLGEMWICWRDSCGGKCGFVGGINVGCWGNVLC